jgi:hypothetical protein
MIFTLFNNKSSYCSSLHLKYAMISWNYNKTCSASITDMFSTKICSTIKTYYTTDYCSISYFNKKCKKYSINRSLRDLETIIKDILE